MCRVFAGFMHVFSMVGVVFCEGRNINENMAKSLLEVYKDCVSKVLHPSLNTVIHSGGPKGASSYQTISPLLGYCMGAKHFVCVCYILHVYSEAVALCLCFHVLAQSR